MKNKETIIFLDLDGVMVDFWSAAVRAFGINPDTVEDKYRNLWDMTSWLTEGNHNAFWRQLETYGPMFWEDLDLYPWAMDMYEELQNHGTVVILTSASSSPAAAAGKLSWIRKTLKTRNFMISKAKWAAAGHDKILIDDYDKNIKEFADHGGISILFKAPWAPKGVAPDSIVRAVNIAKRYFTNGTACIQLDEIDL